MEGSARSTTWQLKCLGSKLLLMQRPWNLVSLPVYSLATYGPDKINMNICTYVTAVSMKPKIMAIAVYHGTQTLENLRQGCPAVLQLLHSDQYALVKNLGKKSGVNWDKDRWLKKRELMREWKGYSILSGCAACMELLPIHSMPSGDHVLHLFEVKAFASFSSEILTTRQLGDLKIIRI